MLSIMSFGSIVVQNVTRNGWKNFRNTEPLQTTVSANYEHNVLSETSSTQQLQNMYDRNIIDENTFQFHIELNENTTGKIVVRTEYRSSGFGPCAKHKITIEILQEQQAGLIKFLNQCSLVKINDIPTRALTSQFLHSLLFSLADRALLQLVVQTENRQYYRVAAEFHCDKGVFKLDINSKSSLRKSEILELCKDGSFTVCQNKKCANCDPDIDKLLDPSLDIEIDYDIEIQHVHAKQLCYIQHVASKLYLKIKNQEIVTHPLEKGDKTMVYDKKMFGGHAPHQPDGNGMVIFVFKETFPDHTAYICGHGPEKISLTKLPPIQSTATILNSFDPRLFRHSFQPSKIADTIVSCFESTCYLGSYLAVNSENNQVKLKKTDKSSLSHDPDIQFLINYEDSKDINLLHKENMNTELWKRKTETEQKIEDKMVSNMSNTQCVTSV